MPLPNVFRLYTGAVAFLVSVAFWPTIAGGAVTPRWVAAALSLYFATPLALLFDAYVFAVLDFDAAVKWAILTGAFCWGLRTDDAAMRTVVKAFSGGVLISGAVAALQVGGINLVPTGGAAPTGLFGNKNAMGETAALLVVLSVRLDLMTTSLLAAPALFLSTCRSAWLAVLLALVAQAPRRVLLLFYMTAVPLVVCSLLIWNAASDLSTLQQRFGLWAFAVQQLSWLGAGSPFEPLHNEFLQAVFELGVGSVVIFAVLFTVASRDLPLAACVAVLSSFGFILHVPASGWLVAIMCGHVVGLQRHDGRVCLRPARHGGGPSLVPSLRA